MTTPRLPAVTGDGKLVDTLLRPVWGVDEATCTKTGEVNDDCCSIKGSGKGSGKDSGNGSGD